MSSLERRSRIIQPIDLRTSNLERAVADAGFTVVTQDGLTVVFAGSAEALAAEYPPQSVGLLTIVPSISEVTHVVDDHDTRLRIMGRSRVKALLRSMDVEYDTTVGNGSNGGIKVYACRIDGGGPVKGLLQTVAESPQAQRAALESFFGSLVQNGRITNWRVGRHPQQAVLVQARIAA
jgi:hypothetical protein